MQTPKCIVGNQSNLQVRGQSATAPSKLTVNGELDVQGGTGNMLIENGGQVQAQQVLVGGHDASGGVATISGVALMITGSLDVGGTNGSTQLEVKDGASLETTAAGQTFIGDNGAKLGPGTVLVHGKTGLVNSTWDAPGSISVGSQLVQSHLVVTDGGHVTVPGASFAVGGNAGELGSVTVSGSDSSIVATAVFIGVSGQGVMTIGDGAHVQCDNGVVAVLPSAGSDLVIINDTSEWHVTNTLLVGAGAPGQILLQGTRIGPLAFGATLRVDGTLTVNQQGSISGNGKLVAGTRVINGGFISPGLSPGVIEIDGDYEQTADGVLKMEAAGLNAGDFDILHVTGNATLAGTLEVRFLNGYLPKTGDVIPFLQLDGTVTGGFDHITFPQLAQGFQFKTEIVDGAYKLMALNDAVLATAPLINISTRAPVGTADNVLIGGFVLQGSDPKKILIRAIGPSLSQFNLPGVLQDPTVELFDSTPTSLARNDNWQTTQIGDVITSDQKSDIEATTLAPLNPAESAIVATLNPGSYTAIVRGVNNTTGIALVEFYDVSTATPTKLVNISSRGQVETADQVMIGGFVISDQTTRVIVRAIGPSLGQFGVANALQDPTVSLFNIQGDQIFSNDNWKDTQRTDIEATSLAPTADAESAIVATLAPGSYTAIVRGANNSTGVGLVEIYSLE